MVIYYIKNKKEYLNLTEKVITEIGFGFRIHSPNLSFTIFIFYLFILFYYYSIMFTIYYFIIIKVARSVGLRICSSSRIWWECPWAKSRTKERNERRRTGWHMPVQSASWFRTLACLKWHVYKKTSGAQLRFLYTTLKNIYKYYWHLRKYLKKSYQYLYI